MNAILRFASMSMVFLISACGGMAEGTYPDSPDAGELESESFGLISQVAQTACPRFSGVRSEPSGLTYTGGVCPSSSSNVYFVPRVKTHTFRHEKGSCSDSQYTALKSMMDTIYAELNTEASIGQTGGWSFTRVPNTGTHLVRCENISSLGTNHIRSYVRTSCTIDQSIPIVTSEVPAVLRHYSSCTIKIDVPDIYARGANATEDWFLLWHALAHGTENIGGVGDYVGNPRMAASDVTVNPVAGRVMFSLGERCRTRNYATTQQHNFYIDSNVNCSDW